MTAIKNFHNFAVVQNGEFGLVVFERFLAHPLSVEGCTEPRTDNGVVGFRSDKLTEFRDRVVIVPDKSGLCRKKSVARCSGGRVRSLALFAPSLLPAASQSSRDASTLRECNGTVEPSILSLVDYAHAPLPELLEDLVVADRGPDHAGEIVHLGNLSESAPVSECDPNFTLGIDFRFKNLLVLLPLGQSQPVDPTLTKITGASLPV